MRQSPTGGKLSSVFKLVRRFSILRSGSKSSDQPGAANSANHPLKFCGNGKWSALELFSPAPQSHSPLSSCLNLRFSWILFAVMSDPSREGAEQSATNGINWFGLGAESVGVGEQAVNVGFGIASQATTFGFDVASFFIRGTADAMEGTAGPNPVSSVSPSRILHVTESIVGAAQDITLASQSFSLAVTQAALSGMRSLLATATTCRRPLNGPAAHGMVVGPCNRGASLACFGRVSEWGALEAHLWDGDGSGLAPG
eukprot:scaffold1850_cov194-Pinguiococcus_pyrenoidosus.AAC.5